MDLIRARGVAPAVTLAALAAGARRAVSQEVGLPLGTPAPAAAVETLDGRPAHLARLVAGRPALVEFWATWCSNCKALEPQIAAVAAKYGSRLQVVTVAVSASQSPQRVRRYVAAHRTPGVVVCDRAGKAPPRTTPPRPPTWCCSTAGGASPTPGRAATSRSPPPCDACCRTRRPAGVRPPTPPR